MLFLPDSFLQILSEFRPVFSPASFANFRVLVAGFLHALGHGRVSDALRAAGSFAEKHYCAYYRFFSRARWCQDEFGLVLLGLVIRLFRLPEVELVLDDTLMRKTGKKIALAGMHADPLLKSGGRPFHSYGHVFVVLAVHILVPEIAVTGWALPFMFRLFEPPRQGGRADSPSDRRRKKKRRTNGKKPRKRVRKTDRKVADGQVERCTVRADTGPLPDKVRPTKLNLATEMILLVARRFPHIRFVVTADHLYNGRAVLKAVHEQVDNVVFVMRGRADAAMYEAPPPRQPGQKGRPRVKGAKFPNPTEWAQAHPEAFELVTVDIYGRHVPLLVASFIAMHYRSLPRRMMRYVVVRDPDGIYKDQFLFSTDPSLEAAEVVERYARRWPLERAFQDCKQKLGVQDSEAQLPTAVRRTAPFGMTLYSLVVLWYVSVGYHEAARLRVHHDPWYDKQARPSFSDMLAALRRLGWASALLDLPSVSTTRQKRMAAYLARVVAAA
jgi:hypothetical protein